MFSLSRGDAYQAMVSLAMHNLSQFALKRHRSPLFDRLVEDKSFRRNCFWIFRHQKEFKKVSRIIMRKKLTNSRTSIATYVAEY